MLGAKDLTMTQKAEASSSFQSSAPVATASPSSSTCTSQPPRVSIGLPVYNGEDLLPQTLDNLLGQTFTDFELIISDNASSDRTEAICRDYAQRDSRIRYYRQSENRGAAWNDNWVLAQAEGEYFKWSAHDDVHASTFLEHCVAALDQNPAWVMCFCRTEAIDWFGNPKASGCDPVQRTLDHARPHRRFAAVVVETFWCAELYGVTRTAIARQLPAMAPSYGMDRVVLAALTLQGQIRILPEVLFWRRIHRKQSSCLDRASQTAFQIGNQRQRPSRPWYERQSIGFIQAIFQAPLSWGDRLACLTVVFRYLTNGYNWRALLWRYGVIRRA